MDKLTKAFVIAASSVVIAVGGVWLNQQYAADQAEERCIRLEMNLDKQLTGTKSAKLDWLLSRGKCRQ